MSKKFDRLRSTAFAEMARRQERIEELELELAEQRLSAQRYEKMWLDQDAVLAARQKEIDRLEGELARVSAKLVDAQDSAWANAHVIVEHGVIPGLDGSCRCDICRAVATAMAEAGYLDRARDKWWEAE